MILVDARAYGGVGQLDRDDCRQIVGGPELVHHPANVMWIPQTDEPVRGIWDTESPRAGAACGRERITSSDSFTKRTSGSTR